MAKRRILVRLLLNVKSPSSNEHTKSALALAKLQSQLSRGDFEIIFAAKKLKLTWHSIVEDARKFDREMRK